MSVTAKTLVAPVKNAATLLETEPSAARIAHAIAAFPYDYLTATMDIVDNGVENGARGVSVQFASKNKLIERIVIADNGTGIPGDIVNEVLRAGSRTNHLYRTTSLSRFGVGLKGAGFALATTITFLTRNTSGAIVRRSIDQARIEATDRWEQETREPTAEEQAFFEETLGALPGPEDVETGTVIILENVKLKTRDLAKLRSELVRRAGETYSKFLSAMADRDIRRLAIAVDKVVVEAFDPLHRDDPGTQYIYKRERIEFADGSSAFFTAVALPHPNQVAPEVARRYRYTQRNQGIYVYRNGRLIRSGETFGLFGRDFHINNFRAELEYDSSAEAHFNLDVAKSTIVLDDEAEGKLEKMVSDSTKTANALWRQKDVPTKVEIEELFNESNRLIGSRANLLIEAVHQKPGELRLPKPGSKVRPIAKPMGSPPANQSAPEDQHDKAAELPAGTDRVGSPTSTSPRAGLGGFLRPADHLPDGVLYRPLWDAEVGLVVEVNVSHPFAKAVFEASAESEAASKRSVPRRATTAIQQLLYVLGFCEFTMSDEEETARLFEQYRRYLSMNVTALLD
ncbi:ATP-binding protein [Bradyrhizobium sp. 155]|uniref:ATP-binding protein n=1 Tax=Bradyrhizobium sp. 155 TaxID=2782629 RepID=UPI001FFEED59|nr:ATP-binding protein [Bradyrhizobium sp. 155]UPK14458.1 ATP-binding protein [Bradyrhizobium sp. 155]